MTEERSSFFIYQQQFFFLTMSDMTSSPEKHVFDIAQLPSSFKKFLCDNAIDPEIYTVADLPRYIRTNTHLPVSQRPTLQQLKDQFETDDIFPVPGLDHFFSVQLGAKRISDISA